MSSTTDTTTKTTKKAPVKALAATAAKKDVVEPSHPKYSVMVADIIKNCENKRTGISR